MRSFEIEAPGEATPLSEEALSRTLQSAASSDFHQIQSGTKQLQQWERMTAFFPLLQNAFLNTQLPFEVRYLAIIQLKNGIDKFWRKTATNAVSANDKAVIRSRLVDSIVFESDNRLALQDAIVIAKIARYEVLNDWPEAVSAFLARIQAPDTTSIQLERSLLALLYIVKELATGRLQRTKQCLQESTPQIVAVVGNVYARLVDSWRKDTSVDQMRQSLLAIKLLRRILIAGHDHPRRASDVVDVWQLSIQHMGLFIPLLTSLDDQVPVSETTRLMGRHAFQLAKLHHEMARDHPASFALMPRSLELTGSYWDLVKNFGQVFGSKETVVAELKSGKIGSDGDASDEKPFLEKISLKGLLIVRACVKMVHTPATIFKTRTAEDKEERQNAVAALKDSLLTEHFVRDAMEVLVTKFFVFRSSDFREWLEEPEEWEKREEGDGEDWEFSIRSCAEKLFLDLAINYKQILVPPLLQVFQSVADPKNEDVLLKDSVYTAVGLAASVLADHLDFDAFIRDVLIAEVQKQDPGYNVLRRRAAIILGQWIGVKVSESSRVYVYQIFQHLLNEADPLNDQVVRVTAGRQFANVANDWEFQTENFLPYAQTILTQLMQLISDVELTETKMALLNSISIVVERLDIHIEPFAERIVMLLPALWERAEDEHLMKQAILTILARLVNAMKAASLPLHAMVFPIIQGALDPSSESHDYLLEDALDLWSAVVAQTPSKAASPDLLNLLLHVLPIYEQGSDNLRKALEITQSYLLLSPAHILSDPVRHTLFTHLSSLFSSSLRSEASGLVCTIIENIIRAAHTLQGEPGVNAIVADLIRVNFLPHLIHSLHGSWKAHCTTGPLAKDPPVDGIIETDYFAILARVSLGSLPALYEVCLTAPPSSQSTSSTPLDSTMHWLLEEWFSHLDNIADPFRRKLMCLALTQLFSSAYTFILAHLQSLMTMWTDVISEDRESQLDISTDPSIPTPNNHANTNPPPPAAADDDARHPASIPEEIRLANLSRTDLVHTTPLTSFVAAALEKVIAAQGGISAFQDAWLVNVDRDVVRAFEALGVL